MESATEKPNPLATISNELAQSYFKRVEDFVDKGDATCIEITSFSVSFPINCVELVLTAMN